MIREIGRIVSIRGTRALVQTRRDSSCSRCALQSGCGQRVLGGMFGGANAQLVVDLGALDSPAIDDELEIGISESGLLASACLAYLVPLLGLMSGMLAGHQIVAEAGAILGAISGLVFAIAITRVVLARTSIGIAAPVFLRRVSSVVSTAALI